MNFLPNIKRHILKPNRSHLDLVWMPSSRGDQPCTYPFLLRAAPRSFLIFFTFFLHILYMFLFSHFHTFLKFPFVCRQMFPQMKFRLTGLDPKVSQSIASGIFSPLVAGQDFCPVFICRTCFLPHFLIASHSFIYRTLFLPHSYLQAKYILLLDIVAYDDYRYKFHNR